MFLIFPLLFLQDSQCYISISIFKETLKGVHMKKQAEDVNHVWFLFQEIISLFFLTLAKLVRHILNTSVFDLFLLMFPKSIQKSYPRTSEAIRCHCQSIDLVSLRGRHRAGSVICLAHRRELEVCDVSQLFRGTLSDSSSNLSFLRISTFNRTEFF